MIIIEVRPPLKYVHKFYVLSVGIYEVFTVFIIFLVPPSTKYIKKKAKSSKVVETQISLEIGRKLFFIMQLMIKNIEIRIKQRKPKNTLSSYSNSCDF